MGVRSCSVVAAALLSLIGGLGLSACSGSPADSIDYAVDGTLVSYNTNTVAGAASGGPQAFARVLTGFNYHGPDGQVVGDHDFGSISVVGRAPLVLDYEISAECGVLRRQADHLRRHGPGVGVTVGSAARVRRGQPRWVQRYRVCRLRAGAEEGAGDLRPGPRVRRLRPAVHRDVDDAVARHRRRTRHRCHDCAAQRRRPGCRTHRAGVEQHLESQSSRFRQQTIPVVGAVQARVGEQGRLCRAGRQRQVVGRKARHREGHRVAAGRRHPGQSQSGRLRRRRRGDWVIGNADPARRLCPNRLAVGRHRTADLRARRDRWRARPRAGRWRCARLAM